MDKEQSHDVEPLQVFDVADLLREKLPPELPEGAYRRGYCDGWYAAIEAMDLMTQEKPRISFKRAFDFAFEFFTGKLRNWSNHDVDRLVLPPILEQAIRD